MNDITYLTIQERIALLEKSMAFSPSDAAAKVISLSEAGMSELIEGNKFLEDYKSKRTIPSVMYKVFCGRLNAAVSKELRKTDKTPYESRFGNNNSDYIYIAALSLAALPARMEKYYDNMPPIYYNLRMTLGNYLDALIDINYDTEKGKPNTRRANQYRKLKKELSKIIDLSTPLCEAIGILLNQYSESHAELDRLSYIESCAASLDYEMELKDMRDEFLDYEEYPDDEIDSRADEEEYESSADNAEDTEDAEDAEDAEDTEDTEDAEYDYSDLVPVAFVTDDDFGESADVYNDPDDCEEYYDEDDDPEHMELEADRMFREHDPFRYYLLKARELPDTSMRSPETLYDMGLENPNLLADNDYSPEGFKARMDAAELLPSFRELAEELITAESIATAFKGMDAATDKLYRLLIEPFAEIRKYRFEQHLASKV